MLLISLLLSFIAAVNVAFAVITLVILKFVFSYFIDSLNVASESIAPVVASATIASAVALVYIAPTNASVGIARVVASVANVLVFVTVDSVFASSIAIVVPIVLFYYCSCCFCCQYCWFC